MQRSLRIHVGKVAMIGAFACLVSTQARAQALISASGASPLVLGIRPFGDMNVPEGVDGYGRLINPSAINGDGFVGLAYFANYGTATGWGDATSPGCQCEGWGVGANGTQVGFSDKDEGGTSNLTLDSFTSTAATATSNVHLTSLPGLSVTQAYSPSSSPALYRDLVTITNTTGAPVTNLRYERAMDWDIPPTTFNENVTIQGWPATNLIHSEDNGFNIPNPYVLSGPQGCAGGSLVNTNFTDSGPCDHGADFVFDFGTLANNTSQTFSIFYGAAPGEAAALAALGAVGAEVYSLGQQAGDGSDHGLPVTFIFGFAGVGGTPVSGVPEPGSLVLLGTGIAGLAAYRRRRI